MYLNSSSLISCDIFDLLCFVIKFLFITNIIFKMITISYLSQLPNVYYSPTRFSVALKPAKFWRQQNGFQEAGHGKIVMRHYTK